MRQDGVRPNGSERAGAAGLGRWRGEVERYLERHPGERTRLAPLLELLRTASDPFDRRCLPGHVTASAFAVADGRLLLIWHPFLQRWLQPGGHVEPGETPAQAAQREFLEETGLAGRLHPWHAVHGLPLDIDAHPIPPQPARGELAHWHYDFRYALQLTGAAARPAEAELRWTPLEELGEPDLLGAVEKLARCGAL